MSEPNERAIIQSVGRVAVLLPVVLRGVFDYRVPEGVQVQPGDYVRVPFGKRSLWGVVWDAPSGEVPEARIKSIDAVAAHLPPMNAALRRFIDWLAWYTLSPQGMVLKMALSSPEALEPPEAEVRYVASELRLENSEQNIKMTPSRQRILSYLSDGVARAAKDIVLHAKVSPAVLREFIKAGGVRGIESTPSLESQPSGYMPGATCLNEGQEKAAVTLRARLANGYSVTVIDGVTGSGKTEVYFDMIAHCLARGLQALVMLPEITLSVQWLSRFEKRFGFTPDVWHSAVSPARKRATWRAVADGGARVVVGARSALFLPFRALGVIIVDEEHDASYKQEDGVIYHARDMAVARAKHEAIPAVLVSATPSLETEQNVLAGRYHIVRLPSRHGDAQLPAVRLIDMRKQALERQSWISPPLLAALLDTLARKKQAMLFINRRGYAPLMLCRACGHRMQCPHCSTALTLHKSHRKLMCHHCGHIVAVPKQCPDCKAEETMIPCGPGVERVAEEVRTLIPQARLEVMTSDLTDTPAKAEALVHAMIAGQIDILVGTQMIAKGHHFAGLALVGVVDADMGLAGGDLRAAERTYQLLHQLSGRAGRESTPGDVWLQTYMPEHPVMQALVAGDRDAFMDMEANMREECAMPPYGKLASVVVEGVNEQEVAGFARYLVRQGTREALTQLPIVLGPAPAPLFLLRNKYRYRILIKTARNFPLQAYLQDWLLAEKVPSSLRVKIDVDPYSFV